MTITCTDDLIHIAGLALGEDSVAALVIDAQLALPITGDVPEDAVSKVDAMLIASLGDVHDRLVLVSRRAGSWTLRERDIETWREMRARHAHLPLDLVEWLVFVDDGVVISMAEATGTAVTW